MMLLGRRGLSCILIVLSSYMVGFRDASACPCSSLKGSPQACRTIQIEACPNGQSGGRTIFRDFVCLGSSFTDSGFYVHQSNCRTGCETRTETKTEACPTGYAGIQTYQRQVSCEKEGDWQQVNKQCVKTITNPLSPVFPRLERQKPQIEPPVLPPPEIAPDRAIVRSEPILPQPSLVQQQLPPQIDISQEQIGSMNLDGYRRNQDFLSELISADAAWTDPNGPAGDRWRGLRRSDLFREDEGDD